MRHDGRDRVRRFWCSLWLRTEIHLLRPCIAGAHFIRALAGASAGQGPGRCGMLAAGLGERRPGTPVANSNDKLFFGEL
jgi:hypothetical protein